MIDKLCEAKGWNRLSEYEGYRGEIKLQCGSGHIWTTAMRNFKFGCGCPFCAAENTRKRMQGVHC